MKQSINLVIQEHPAGENNRFQVWLIPGGAIILLFLLILGSTSNAQKVMALQKQVEHLSQQREEVNRNISNFAKGFSTLNQQGEDQNQRFFLGDPVPWSRILEEVGQRLPGHVWLLQIESFTEGNGALERKGFRITGVANGHGDVERFISSLEQPDLWKDIRLVYAQKVADPPYVEFQVTARIQ